MAARVDLDGFEAGVRAFVGGVAPSTGWTLLDLLERYLAGGLIEEGTPAAERAGRLLAAIRGKLSAADEFAATKDALSRVTDEYNAGLTAVSPGSAPDGDVWNALIAKGLEKRMYEARLRAAQARL